MATAHAAPDWAALRDIGPVVLMNDPNTLAELLPSLQQQAVRTVAWDHTWPKWR